MKPYYLIFLILFACTSSKPAIDDAHTPMPADSNERIIDISVRVHIVTDADQMPCIGVGVVGCWSALHEVWILGEWTGGEIIVSSAVLGHEILHEIHYIDYRITDPWDGYGYF